jgi:amidase
MEKLETIFGIHYSSFLRVTLAQGTNFGCSIRIPTAFLELLVFVRHQDDHVAPGLGSVNGPLARNAEDAAVMLDAMMGFSELSPISVVPPLELGPRCRNSRA